MTPKTKPVPPGFHILPVRTQITYPTRSKFPSVIQMHKNALENSRFPGIVLPDENGVTFLKLKGKSVRKGSVRLI